MNNLSYLEFWFENCEGVTIPAECINNLDYKIEDNKITEFKCNIVDNGKTNYSTTWADNDITPLQRITKYNDITSIKFTYDDGESKDYYVIWDDSDSQYNSYQNNTSKSFREIDLSIDKTNLKDDAIVFKCRKCEHMIYVTDTSIEKLDEVSKLECPNCGEEGYENWVLMRSGNYDKDFENT
jgi:DNA-directed RNA polymerase subunit RPC12/RpoP